MRASILSIAWTNGGGFAEAIFLTTPLSAVENPLLIGTWGPPLQRINGKVTSRVTIGSIGHMCGIRFTWVNKQHSYGLFGTKQWPLMNGGLALRMPLSPSSASFAFPTQADRLSISFGIVFKLGGRGDGPCSLCTNFVGSSPAIITALIGNKSSSRKGFLRNMAEY
jgi:hypothetical protein